jgi:hypothetical protein
MSLKINHLRPFCLFVTFLTWNFVYHANCQDTVKIKRYASPIEFDGRPFEEAWNGLGYFPMTMHQPDFGREPLEKSEIMITYDNEYVWIGARLYMNDASKIVVYGKKRDDRKIFYDGFDVAFDTYDDNENALVFYTNPAGLRSDYAVANDAVMGTSGWMNNDWNTYWDVKTSMDDRGWFIEMRIPFSSLKFKPDENNITTMGLIIRRWFSYNHGMDTYPILDPKYGTSRPSLAATIQFEGAKPSNPVYISPYVIGGHTRNWKLNDEKTEYVKDDTPDFDAGLDIKYNVSNNLTLDLTANTDFAQVEADDQQVNLTRYSLFFPEKRVFFQERSGLFSFGLGGNSNLFYSRNIGLSDGKSIRIYGGARLVGRAGKWDIGILDMQTEEHGDNPGENFGVARLRRQVINANSFVGGIFTSRIGMNGAHNFAYGLDGVFRVFGNDYLMVKASQTYDDMINNKLNSIDPMYLSTKWERRTERGFAYTIEYSYSGQEFKPGIGFVNRGSLQGFAGNVIYAWLPPRESKIFTITAYTNASRYTRLEDGKLESLSFAPGASIETKTGYKTILEVEYQQEGVLNDFPIAGNVQVLAGNYSFTGANLSLQTPAGKHLVTTLSLNGGEFYDGNRYGVTLRPNYNVSASLQLSGSYQFNHIYFTDRNQDVDIHIASVKVLYMFSTKLSTSLLVQYVSTTDDLISNFRFRFNPREGNDFYLVFNDYRCVSDEEFIPDLPHYFTRTILLKYTHTFRL